MTDVDVFDPRTFGRGVPHEASCSETTVSLTTEPIVSIWSDATGSGSWSVSPSYCGVNRICTSATRPSLKPAAT